jgi:hypothetical protein
MADPVLESARTLVGESLDQLRSSLEGLPPEALNWQVSPEANSIAVLATHAAGATRLWLHLAMGIPLPDRDRDAEFLTVVSDGDEFMRGVAQMADDCAAALNSAENVDWAAPRQTQGRGGDAAPEVTAGYALIHATEHLRGHVDQVALVRQLWEAQA